ncbi:hypothetical protein GW17_00000601 [Ensete ventricosum]|nr:hypothetical protein GW17_00000601 [Ensete ventricosum]
MLRAPRDSRILFEGSALGSVVRRLLHRVTTGPRPYALGCPIVYVHDRSAASMPGQHGYINLVERVNSGSAMDLTSLHGMPKVYTGKSTLAAWATSSSPEVEEVYMETAPRTSPTPTTKRPAKKSALQ